ncbi:MAG: hypothetical protein J5I59_12615 [Saprospiraceae bacterium]|nr:hypothetical protein [Saprospiraceae bacterium]
MRKIGIVVFILISNSINLLCQSSFSVGGNVSYFHTEAENGLQKIRLRDDLKIEPEFSFWLSPKLQTGIGLYWGWGSDRNNLSYFQGSVFYTTTTSKAYSASLFVRKYFLNGFLHPYIGLKSGYSKMTKKTIRQDTQEGLGSSEDVFLSISVPFGALIDIASKWGVLVNFNGLLFQQQKDITKDQSFKLSFSGLSLADNISLGIVYRFID